MTPHDATRAGRRRCLQGDPVRARRRALLLAGLCLLAGAVSGCWDYRDLERRSPILGMAVDARSDPGSRGYRVTVEIPYPALGGPPGGGGGNGGGGGGRAGGGGNESQSAKVIISGEGGTLGSALVSLSARLERQPLWEHLLAVALSDSVAREGVSPVVDALLRGIFLNARARLFIVEGSAEQLLATAPDLQPLTSRFLRGLEEQFAEFPRFARVLDVRSFDHQHQDTGVALLPRVTLAGGSLVAEGAAIVQSGRLKGWLDADITEGVNWWLGNVNTAVIEFPCPEGDAEDTVTLRARAGGSSLKLEQVDGGYPVFQARFTAYGRLLDLARCPFSPDRPHERRRLEEAAARLLEQRIGSAVEKAQSMDIDFIRLGLHIRRHHPDLWRRLDWPADLPRVRVQVSARVVIDDAGDWYRPPRFH